MRWGSLEDIFFIFHIFKNIQFACSRINLLYLGHSTINNKMNSPAARKGNWGCGGGEVRILAGSKRKPQICSSCEKELALT